MSAIQIKKRTIREIIKDDKKRLAVQIIFFAILLSLAAIGYISDIAFFNEFMQTFAIAAFIAMLATAYDIMSGVARIRYLEGSIDAVPTRNDIPLKSLLEKCNPNDKVSILLGDLKSLTNFVRIFSDCAEKGVKIRICVYNPEKAGTYFHLRPLYDNANDQFTAMHDSLGDFITANKNVSEGKKMDIRVSDVFPIELMLIINDDCFVPFMFSGKENRSQHNIHFHFCFNEADKQRPFEQFKKHFESIFNDSQTRKISSKELEQIRNAWDSQQTNSN
ncbi:MAG: hypothetical protein LBI79_01120 [Nitrososphaerota archaeon]|jgi:hypothetical protein|nr:hypothetical protein [Nitrososphaerota archaeon]